MTGGTALAGMLAGRVAVVIGATGWIGTSISRVLRDAGADLVLVARDEQRLGALQRDLAAGEHVVTAVADVTSQLEVDDARAVAIARFGHIDLVVVTSGVITGSAFEDGIPADWAEMIDVNLRGLLHSAQTFADPLLASAERGRPSDLVLLGSVSAESHTPRFAVFNAISASIKQLGRTLRDEYGPRGVRVHVVEPGFAPGVAELDHERSESGVTPEAIAAVVAVSAALPATANLAEAVILPTGRS